MSLNPVIIAIPMYFLLMAIELAYENIKNRRTYRLHDAVTNISTGTLQQLTGTFIAVLKVGLYTWFFHEVAPFQLDGWISFLLAMVLWDLCYYWEHRMAHRVSLFWGGHVVHHQSEDYNLSVALRQTSTGFLWGIPFYLPMALVGIDPVTFALAGGFNLLYQFWIHTEHIDKLPRWFEYVFNTPSHHRVHHGRDPKYIDKNYGGIFIIWDRLFGTFKAEEERPNYGVTTPLRSWNPVYANFAHYVWLWRTTRQSRSLGDTAKMLFKPPGWQPDYLGGPLLPPDVDPNYQKFTTRTDRRMNGYIVAQFLVLLGVASFYFFLGAKFSLFAKIAVAVWIVWTTVMFGMLFEGRGVWTRWLEPVRLVVLPLLGWLLVGEGQLPGWSLGVLGLVAFGSGVAFWWVRGNRAEAVSFDVETTP